MKSKSRFLWLYTILLFSIALLLILFAGMTQQEAENHETTSVGLQKNVIELTEKIEKLKSENAALLAEVETANEQKASMEQAAAHNERNEVLIKAIGLYYSKDYVGARELIKSLDMALLTPEQLVVYNRIMK